MTGRRMVRWIRSLATSAAVVCLGIWNGADSMLDSQVQGSGAHGKTQAYNKDKDYEGDKNYDKNQNHKEARGPFDEVDLITPEEAGKLGELITQCRKKIGMDVTVVIVYNDSNHTASKYADGFYDQNRLGAGRKAGGVLFLIYMDRPGSYGDGGCVSTTGNVIRILTDQRIEQVQDDAAYPLKTRDYAGAAAEFLKDAEYYMDRRIQGGQYNYDTETGEISIYRNIRWYEGVFAFLVSAGVAGSVCMRVKRRYSMEPTGRKKTDSLLAYRADAKSAFGDAGDSLIREFIAPAPISRPTQNHSSGGSGRGSGRSSTHRSSNGRSHGGGGRRSQRDIKCALCTF